MLLFAMKVTEGVLNIIWHLVTVQKQKKEREKEEVKNVVKEDEPNVERKEHGNDGEKRPWKRKNGIDGEKLNLYI